MPNWASAATTKVKDESLSLSTTTGVSCWGSLAWTKVLFCCKAAKRFMREMVVVTMVVLWQVKNVVEEKEEEDHQTNDA